MRSKKRIEKRPPKIWDLPFEIRRQLSGHAGRQRTIIADDNLLIVLRQVPAGKSEFGDTVSFWKDREHQWHFSERGGGLSALERLVQDYDDRVAALEESLAGAEDSEARFQTLDEVTPVLRAVRGLCDALGKAREWSDQHVDSTRSAPSQTPKRATSDKNEELPEPSKLHVLFDHASEISRSAEFLKSDIEGAIRFAHARQQEIQSHYVRQQSQAAHRLNILAATFLPVATISSVFGMNLASGLEKSSFLFWIVLLLATVVGAWIGFFVMNVRQLNPQEW